MTGPPRSRRFPASRARRIRLLVVDVDGTLTDGGLYYIDGEDRSAGAVRFHVRDGLGLSVHGQQACDHRRERLGRIGPDHGLRFRRQRHGTLRPGERSGPAERRPGERHRPKLHVRRE